jgi:two-component system, NtrC family, sensor kinase
VQIADVLTDPDYTLLDQQRGGNYRIVLGIPLLREGVQIGLIILMRRLVQPFSEKQIEHVTIFADQAVIAIENARLFDEVQSRTRELQESLEYQSASSEVLSVISRSPTDVQPVFDTIAESAANLCHAEFCNVFRFDGQLVYFAAAHGTRPDAIDAMRSRFPLPPGRGFAAGRAIRRCHQVTSAISQ